ncbi:MAG: cupin domain-containing protein [Chloroflexota bacterium]
MVDNSVRLPLGVCVVPSTQTMRGGSRLNYSLGIARETCGAQCLAMSLVIVPPGGAARPHYHRAGATIIHILTGRSEMRFGQRLSQSVVSGPGDFIYIGAGMPHAPRNLSDRESAIAINARTDATQEEPIVPIEPSETLLTIPADGVWTVNAPATVMNASQLSVERITRVREAETSARQSRGETGVYVARGMVALRYGEQLEHSIALAHDNFVFVPPGVAHQWRAVGDEAALLVVARTGADE